MTRIEDKQLTQTGIAASVMVHALLFFIMAWLLGLDQAARELWRQARVVNEVPQVTLLFPEQIIPVPALKPKDTSKREFISTSANESAAVKPAKADFESDRNTKAAAKASPFPDATAPLPSMRGTDLPNVELANREYQDGKLATNDGAKAVLTPRTPQEPKALPEQVAKAEPTPMAKLMQEVDKSDARLSVDVRKPTESALPQVEPPKESPMMPALKGVPDNFSPLTETAKTKGTITTKGDDAVDSESTPMGKYKASIHAALGKKWYEYQLKNRSAVSFGTMRVMFYVNRQGKVEDIEFLEKAGNPLMEDFTVKAIRDAAVPVMPRDVADSLDNERLRVEYSFVIH